MRVNWLTYTSERNYDRVESTLWIRGYQLFPYLEELGIECLLNASPDAAPIAVMLRWQDDRAWETARAVKACGGKVVFDLCVNYFEESGMFEGGYGVTAEQVKQCRQMVELADVVTCASANIAERARRDHACVVYLPDSIDFKHFNRVKGSVDFDRPRLRAIWSGTAVKAEDVRPVLPLLLRRGYCLTVVAERDPFAATPSRRLWMKTLLGYRFVPWHYDTFPAAIVSGDICVSPRDASTLYNQGHSFYKIGVFMAEGVPAIASSVSSYVEVLDNGGGWVCRTPGEWRAALHAASSDRDELRKRAAVARETMGRYSSQHIAGDWAGLLARLGNGFDMAKHRNAMEGKGNRPC
jgi:hypothetical protein